MLCHADSQNTVVSILCSQDSSDSRSELVACHVLTVAKSLKFTSLIPRQFQELGSCFLKTFF